jgi:PAS domain S-box-containing protein
MQLPSTATTAAVDAFARARARQVTGRLPFFASLWLGLAVPWEILQVTMARVPWPAAASYLGLVAVTLAAALALCRRDPDASRVRWIVLVACLLLALASAVRNACFHGYSEAVAFALFLLCLTSSLLFAWGWRLAAVLALWTLVIWQIVRGSLALFVAPDELAVGCVFGSIVWIAVAEGSARAMRRAWEQQQARERAVYELALSRDAYRDLAENASDLIYTHDLEGRFTYVNTAFARYAGVDRAAMIGRSVLDVLDASRPNPDPRAVIARIGAGEAVPSVTLAVTTDAGERWVECVVSGIRDGDGRVTGVRGIARDVTDRVRAEDALRASYEEIRRREEEVRLLARRQSAVREEERKRLGVDLHDGVCQEVVGIGFDLEILRQELGTPSPQVASRLDRLRRYVGMVVEHLRLLAHDLRPMVLLDLGLEESLRALARGTTSSQTRVDAVLPPAIPRLDESTALGVYRIAQEAVANAVRHARARAITVTLAVEGRSLRLEVRDDGCGFAASGRRHAGTIGLLSMEERARAIGGRLEIRSAVGRGTTVTLTCAASSAATATAA